MGSLKLIFYKAGENGEEEFTAEEIDSILKEKGPSRERNGLRE